jgi:hypothetical protein
MLRRLSTYFKVRLRRRPRSPSFSQLSSRFFPCSPFLPHLTCPVLVSVSRLPLPFPFIAHPTYSRPTFTVRHTPFSNVSSHCTHILSLIPHPLLLPAALPVHSLPPDLSVRSVNSSFWPPTRLFVLPHLCPSVLSLPSVTPVSSQWYCIHVQPCIYYRHAHAPLIMALPIV